MNKDGSKKIIIPEEDGIPAVVLTWDNGQRSYLHAGEHRGEEYSAGIYCSMIDQFLTDENFVKKNFLGLPSAEKPEHPTWFSKSFLREHVAHIHDAIVTSPLAQRKRGGQEIVVPMPGFDVHGPGKRGRN